MCRFVNVCSFVFRDHRLTLKRSPDDSLMDFEKGELYTNDKESEYSYRTTPNFTILNIALVNIQLCSFYYFPAKACLKRETFELGPRRVQLTSFSYSKVLFSFTVRTLHLQFHFPVYVYLLKHLVQMSIDKIRHVYNTYTLIKKVKGLGMGRMSHSLGTLFKLSQISAQFSPRFVCIIFLQECKTVLIIKPQNLRAREPRTSFKSSQRLPLGFEAG